MANILSRTTNGKILICIVDVNPSIGLGTPAPIGSFSSATDGSGFFYKFGVLDTNWNQLIQSVYSAQYVQLGAQPATVGAGQPFTYTTEVLSSPRVTANTAIFNPPFTTSGTVFTLADIGRYEINYQMNYPVDAGVMLYLGSTIPTMSPLSYTSIGKTPDGSVSGSVIIETTTPNSFLSVNAAAGNSVAISIPPNSSTTNQSATTVSIKRVP